MRKPGVPSAPDDARAPSVIDMRAWWCRYPVALPIAVLAVPLFGWVWFARVSPQLDAASARREIYGALPTFPGAEPAGERSSEVRMDGRPTGEFELEVVYRLPDEVAASEVIDFYREHIPAGWTAATDATCATAAWIHPPPLPAPNETAAPRTPLVLLQQESTLTLFVSSNDAWTPEGLTIRLTRTAEGKFVTFAAPMISCGVPAPDPMAASFDAQ